MLKKWFPLIMSKRALFLCGIGLYIFVFGSSCVTTTLIRTSLGYPDNKRIKENEVPEWLDEYDMPNLDWIKNKEEEARKNGLDTRYFVGKYLRKPSSDSPGWVVDDAGLQAKLDAQVQVSNDIITVVTGKTTVNNKEIIKKDNSNIDKKDSELDLREEFFLLERRLESASTFTGLKLIEYFSREYETSGKKNRIEYVHYWGLYSIPQENIDAAWEEIQKGRDEARDEQKRRESQELRDKTYFDSLAKRYKEIMDNLRNPFLEDEEFRRYYTELRDINIDLQLLTTLKDKNVEYNKMLEDIAGSISEFDPVDKQKRMIRDLETEKAALQKENSVLSVVNALLKEQVNIETIIRDMKTENTALQNENVALIVENISLRDHADNEITILDLETEKAALQSKNVALTTENVLLKEQVNNEIINVAKQGVTLVSHYNLVSFPQKPQETLIESGALKGSIYVAQKMVTNRDYISFATTVSNDEIARMARGLDQSVASISWRDAALYCNWLSELFGYTPCYEITNDAITYDPEHNGYRLPNREEIEESLRQGVIKQTELSEKTGIWSSDVNENGALLFRKYRMPEGKLEGQNTESDTVDSGTGIRIVRNARN
jgi:hypothetical protein